MPKEKAPYKYLSMIMLHSVIKAKKKYYPQTLLEEGKYEDKRIKTEYLIDDDLEKGLPDNDYNDEMESDDESLLVYINHVLLGFCLRQSV